MENVAVNPPVIQPTVGRIVWFYDPALTDKVMGAMIAAVNDDGTVNLMVSTTFGTPMSAMMVQLVQAGERTPQGRYCTWMPYQIGQAAKTEQALSQLGDSTPKPNYPPELKGAA